MKKLLIVCTALLLNTAVNAQDATRQTTTTTTQEAQQSSATQTNVGTDAKMADGVVMKDNKMWVMKGGKTMEMTSDMTLRDGSVVMVNGMVKHTDGSTVQMKNGERIDVNGKVAGTTVKATSTEVKTEHKATDK